MWLARALVCIALCALPRIASADPSDADKASARSLMMRGYDALDAGKADEAEDAFKAADALVHVPTTAYALARAQVARKKLVEANETLVRLGRIPVLSDESPDFATARTEASKLLATLSERIPSITIVVRGARVGAAVNVRVDGRTLPSAVLGTPLMVNPGGHLISIISEDREAKQQLDIDERGRERVVLLLPPAHSHLTPPGPEHASSSGLRPLAVTGLVIAGVGVIAGTTTGFLALRAKSRAEDAGCANDRCPPAAQDDAHGARTFATVSTASFVFAGAGAAMFLGDLLLGSSQKPRAQRRLSPYAGLLSGGIAGELD